MQGPGRDHRRNWGIFELAAGNWVQISEGLSRDRKSRQVCVCGPRAEHRGQGGRFRRCREGSQC